jgi:hypothetical protein
MAVTQENMVTGPHTVIVGCLAVVVRVAVPMVVAVMMVVKGMVMRHGPSLARRRMKIPR